jgi:hypothetical protein
MLPRRKPLPCPAAGTAVTYPVAAGEPMPHPLGGPDQRVCSGHAALRMFCRACSTSCIIWRLSQNSADVPNRSRSKMASTFMSPHAN